MLVVIDRRLLHLSVTPGSCLQEKCDLIAERPVEPILSGTVGSHPVLAVGCQSPVFFCSWSL